jgi:hypothetical protein
MNGMLSEIELVFNQDLDFRKTNLDVVKVIGLDVKVVPNPGYSDDAFESS